MRKRKEDSADTHGIHLVSDDRRAAFIAVMSDLIQRASTGEISVMSVTEYNFGTGRNKYVEVAFEETKDRRP